MDPAQGQGGRPASFHKYLYAYANPTVYIDPDGETNKEALGIDDASVEASMREDSLVWGATKYAAKTTFYETWNFFTGGFVKRHDHRLELRDAGKITQEQYEKSLALDATVSIVANVAGAGVGGKVAGAVGGRVGGSAAGQVVTAAAAGGSMAATVNAAEQAGQVVEHHLISEALGRAEMRRS